MLTRQDAKALMFIQGYREANGFPPTLTEVKDALAMTNVADLYALIGRLERGGYVKHERGKARTLRLLCPIAEVF